MRVDSALARSTVKDALAGLAITSRHKPEDVRPLGDQVMVKPDSPLDRTRTGLYIPEKAQRHEAHLRTGTVVAAGLGDKLADGARYPMHVAVGDRVVYDQASNRVVVLDGEEFLILHEEQHILMVFEEPASLPFETL